MKKLLVLIFAVACASADVSAQSLFNKIKNKVEQGASKAIDKEFDKSSSKKPNSKSSNQESSSSTTSSSSSSSSGTQSIETVEENTGEATESKKLESKTRYDFVPGEKVIFSEDFSQESVGEFPSKWFTRSKGETVTLNTAPGKWMRLYPGGFLSPTIDMKENYTVEFDLIMDWPVKGGYLVPSFGIGFYDRGFKTEVFSYDYRLVNNMAIHITPFRSEGAVTMTSREEAKPKFSSDKVHVPSFDKKSGKVIHVAISVQKERFRLWLDEEKVFDIPGAAPYPGNFNQLKVEMNSSNYTNDQIGYYVSNFRIASGVNNIKSRLVDEGKVSTTGIQFDVNSDNLRPESYGTINEIAKVLKENPDMKIRVIGHTDNSGSAADNLILSKKRADAVIKVLTSEYGIASDALQADGKGSTAPVADNKTAEGRAMNRRVEFVKM